MTSEKCIGILLDENSKKYNCDTKTVTAILYMQMYLYTLRCETPSRSQDASHHQDASHQQDDNPHLKKLN